jgi:ribosomal-protein-alanine N-acetyltransferase
MWRERMEVFVPQISLECPRLMLKPLLANHASDIYSELLNPSLYKYIPDTPPNSLRELEDRYSLLESRKSADGKDLWLNWVARLRNQQQYVGTFQATIYANKTAEIAYIVFVQFWRRGYGKEACDRMLRHLLIDYEVGIIFANMDTRNLASIRLVESLGFRRMSLIQNADYFKGSRSDEYRYAITKEQFDADSHIVSEPTIE